MRVDLLNTGMWEDFNERIKALIVSSVAPPPQGLGPDQWTARAYPGLAAALSEIALGTSLFFSHKKSMGIVRGETWAFDAVLPHLYKQGLQVTEAGSQMVDNWKDWVDGLPSDTNFVLWTEDHPVTGEVFDRSELDAALNAKRIYSISVSHSAHRYRAAKLGPYSVRICSYDDEITAAQCGQRFRTPPVSVHRMKWNEEKFKNFQAAIQKIVNEDEASIRQFEKALDLAGTDFKIFSFGGQRLWDRAVIYNLKLNAEALLSQLVAGSQLQSPGLEDRAEIVNSCRWTFLPELHTWWTPLPDENLLRGLLVLDVKLVQQPDFIDRLKKASADAQIG